MILAAVLLALVSCAPRPSASGAQDRPYSWTAIDAPPAPLSVPVSLFDVVYSREGDLYRAVVDAGTLATVNEVSLGKAGGLQPIAGTRSIIADDDSGIVVVNARGDRRRFSPPVSPLPVGGVAYGGTVYIGNLNRISIADADGNVLRTFDAPRAKPGLPALPAGFKGVIYENGSQVADFLFDPASSFVVVQSPANSAIVDLERGTRTDLIGVRVAGVASQGDRAFVLGQDTTVVDPHYLLIEVDLNTLDVVRTTRFTVDRPARSVNRMRLLVTPRGDVFAYFSLPLTSADVPIRSDLVAFDPRLAPRHVSLPNDIGLDATVGADGALFVFGGPARNVVARFDPLTRDLTRYSVAPDGTFVRALIAR